MTAMTRRLVLLSLLALAPAFGLAGSGSAAAQGLGLDEARAQGLVGERPDGLIAAVAPNPAPEVQALVARINDARMQEYRRIAADEGTSVRAVQAVMAQKLIDRLPSGSYVLSNSGNWVRK